PYCELYDQGFKRIGCVMCPMSGQKGMLRDKDRYPRIANCFLKAFDNMIKNRKDKNLPCDWETPEEVMKWWIYTKKNKKINPDQTVMFE
ncbi:unnamed protein product, partial [marine sediment metagenome]